MRFGLREAVFILLLLAIPVAAYFLVFKPRNVQIATAREEVRAKQAKLRQLEAATRTLEDLGQEIDKLEQAIVMFEHKLPAQREVEVILRQVSDLAIKHQLTVRTFRSEKVVPAARYSEQPIRMSIVGEFDGYYSFLLDLERLPRITQLPKLQIKKARGDQGKLEAEMTLSIYFDSGDPVTAAGAAKGRT